MDFALTPEQLQIRDTYREFCKRHACLRDLVGGAALFRRDGVAARGRLGEHGTRGSGQAQHGDRQNARLSLVHPSSVHVGCHPTVPRTQRGLATVQTGCLAARPLTFPSALISNAGHQILTLSP